MKRESDVGQDYMNLDANANKQIDVENSIKIYRIAMKLMQPIYMHAKLLE